MKTTTREATLEVLNPARCESIAEIDPVRTVTGCEKHYLNLRGLDQRFRGDINTMLWIDPYGVLVHRPGPGQCSEPFRTDRDAVIALAKANGIAVKKQA